MCVKTGTVEKLTDYITENVIGPHDPGGAKRKKEVEKRRRKAQYLLQFLEGK